MLIKAPQLRSGGRDPIVWDLIEWFDQEKYLKIPEESRMSKLNMEELGMIAREADRIRQDYRYAARNYFWISDKNGRDVLMQLWDGQELVLQKMEDMKARGKSQKVIVIKARQLGMSIFGCSLLFWVTAFRTNRQGLLVSEDDDQTTNLFNTKLSSMYRMLPWWLRPKASSFTIDKGIVFDVKNKADGMGLNSRIGLQWSNRKGGVGQGYTLNVFHGSEFTKWMDFSKVLETGLKHALVRSPETMAILESTAQGAGTPSHEFYNKCANMAEKSDWESLFLPYFFEKTYVITPPVGWKPDEKERRRKETVYDNWVCCANRQCARFFNRKIHSGVRDGQACPQCKAGLLAPYVLKDDQNYFITNEIINASDPKIIKQEMALTAEEAFVAMGDQIFSEKAIENLEYTCTREAAKRFQRGFFDKFGVFHGYHLDDMKRQCHCEGCTAFHEGEEQHVWIWEKYIPGARYHIGVDIGYGKGQDYSVAWVNRVGAPGQPDSHVATMRSNIIEPIDFAYQLFKLGRMYGDAEIAVEYNSPGNSTADQLLNNLFYPNVYKRKGQQVFNTTGGNQFHWLTMSNTKPKLIVTMDRWLKEGIFNVKDPTLLEEVKTFTKERDSVATGASRGSNDDTCVAAMICLYTSHQSDYEQDGGIVPTKVDDSPENCMYRMDCTRCGLVWGADNPSMFRKCPSEKCGCLFIKATRNLNVNISKAQDPQRDIRDRYPVPDGADASWEEDDNPKIKDYALL